MSSIVAKAGNADRLDAGTNNPHAYHEGPMMMFVRRVCSTCLQSARAGAALFIGLLSAVALSTVSPAQANEKITYLFPAPPLLPAFGPIRLAQGKGYFSQAGLDVSFATGRGGVDVAKEV